MEQKYGDKLILSEFWAEYLAKSQKCRYNIAIGAYRSSKSTFNILAFAFYLNTLDFEGLHLVLASTSSVAQTIVADGSGFGLSYIFLEKYKTGKYKDLDCAYITNAKGIKQTVLFLGGSKVSDFQRFRGFSIDGIIMEEADLLHQNTINEAAGRTWASKKPFYALSSNPCSEKVPYRQWIKQIQENTPEMVNFIRASIYDNPSLSPKRINEIVSSYDPNSLFFKKFILGLDCLAEGLIYRLIPENYFKDINKSNYIDYIIIADPGKTKSSTGFLCLGRNIINKSLDVLFEMKHRNTDLQSRVYTTSDYARLLCGFIRDCAEKLNRMPTAVIIDSFAGDDFYENLRKQVIAERLSVPIKFPIRSDGKNGKDEKPAIITRELDLFFRKKLRINEQCRFLIDDIQNATYDKKLMEEKGIETRSDIFNIEGHSDMLDCLDYGVSFYGPLMNTLNLRK